MNYCSDQFVQGVSGKSIGVHYENAPVVACAFCLRKCDRQRWSLSFFKYDVDACAISARPHDARQSISWARSSFWFFYRYSNSKFEKVSSVVLEPKSMFLVPSMTNNGTTALTPKWRVDLIWESNSLHEFWDFFEKRDTFCLLGHYYSSKK